MGETSLSVAPTTSLDDAVLASTVPSGKKENEKSGCLELILSKTRNLVSGVRKRAENAWYNLPIDWQMRISTDARTAAAPAAYLGRGLRTYYDNLASSRFLMYQFIGGIGTVGVKLVLPRLGILDDGSFSQHLQLQVLATAGQVAVQMPAYVVLEGKKYGQSILHAAREYLSWRSLEILLSLPGYLVNAGQATGAGYFVGPELGAASTSLPFSTGSIFKVWHIPVFHGIYIRLQIRKEAGEQIKWHEVFTILEHGAVNAASLLKETCQKYVAGAAATALKTTQTLARGVVF